MNGSGLQCGWWTACSLLPGMMTTISPYLGPINIWGLINAGWACEIKK